MIEDMVKIKRAIALEIVILNSYLKVIRVLFKIFS